ncbi:MAG: DUF2752 domain-containing protein [Nocardioidaceae bacterium]|nr:DUF2752 domain-containing protein [Nocardioidaceae bacterium]
MAVAGAEASAAAEIGAGATQRPRWRRMVAPTLVVTSLSAATLALHLRDPHADGSWGVCPSAALGLWCPGCGGLRAVNDLSDLNVGAAASSNLLFFCALPLIAYAFARWSLGRWTARAWTVSDRSLNGAAVGLAAVMVVFTVLRNLPGSWLAP